MSICGHLKSSPDPKTAEGIGMTWRDYFWKEGGWIGWIIVYWILFVEHFVYSFLPQVKRVEIWFIVFLLFGLVLSSSAIRYRFKWNNKFKELKELWLKHHIELNTNIANIFNKLNYLYRYPIKQEDKNNEWEKLFKDFQKYLEDIGNTEDVKKLKGDKDYELET